ncbi:hypothetical protein QBC44DRAFT_327479 [Cladorrhinum sp. PSN332]|nr:hypothetical protein QBC44DRAFT_327479 [Cladorrhinum sp. PSN332]
MADSQPPTHASISPAILTSSIECLVPALEILSKFHHRNRNQHRLSKWWAQADMVRRHTRKMVELLEDVLPEAEKQERIRNNAFINNKKVKKEPEKENEAVIQRAQYMRWQLGPGAFLAFTQVTADRQFAQLGLLLIGVLAQIDKALEPFSPTPPPDLIREQDFPLLPTSEEAIPKHATATVLPGEPIDTDLGVAVSRESLALRSIEHDEEEQVIARVKENKRAAEQDSTIPPERKPRQVKKIKSGGDEFDNIFGSISEPPIKKKSAKKKAAPMDEFDAIFGGDGGGDGGDNEDQPKKKNKKKKQHTVPTTDEGELEERGEGIVNFFAPPRGNLNHPNNKYKEEKEEQQQYRKLKNNPITIPADDDRFDDDTTFGSMMMMTTTATTTDTAAAAAHQDQQPKKKKAKVTEVGDGGDNVGNVGTTIKKTTTKKKKKKGGGDEFDNIFGGL